MGLLLKSLSRIESLNSAPAIQPIEKLHDRETIHEPSRGNMLAAATAVPLEFDVSTVNVAVRPREPATPLEIDTSSFCLTIPPDEPFAPSSDVPISLDSQESATAIEPIEDAFHRTTIREPSRGKTATAPIAVPLEFEASTVSVAIRPGAPATPLEIDTSTICLTIPSDEPFAASNDVPISLEALFAAPFPSEATDGAARPIALAVASAPPSKPPTSLQAAPPNLATALDRLEQLQQTLAEDVTHPEVTAHGPSLNTPHTVVHSPPKLRPEFRELSDHLLSRFPLTKHCTLLVVDAGRAPLDHTWLLPLAAGLLESIANPQARALLIEVDPCASGIAEMLGIDATSHSVDGASDTAAFSNTYHPQIDIVRLSAGSLAAVTARLEETWPELQESYNLILVASGPLADTSRRANNPADQIVGSLLPLAGAVILSVELGSTPVSVANETAELLKAAGANLLGCVVQAAAGAD